MVNLQLKQGWAEKMKDGKKVGQNQDGVDDKLDQERSESEGGIFFHRCGRFTDSSAVPSQMAARRA